MQADITVEARNLSKTLGNRVVLSSVCLQISRGEIVGVVGANGSGKTTLLRCLAGRLRPTSGTVLWFGQPAYKAQARRNVGLLGHECFLYPHLTVRDNLLFAARMHDVVSAQGRVDELIASAGVAKQRDTRTCRISRGIRQRVAILRAIVHDPPILFLDEPSSSLDSRGIDWLLDLLYHRRHNGYATCLATHDDRLATASQRIIGLLPLFPGIAA
jgi:ABC-type multidrug transport system ATPase subunit